MAESTSPVKFSDFSLWTPNASELEHMEVEDMSYLSYIDSAAISPQNSSTSPQTERSANSTRPHRFQKAFEQQGLQLPSPQDEDDIAYDPPKLDKERRRRQNRAAQRAFRERKESKLKQLERQIEELETEKRKIERKYNNLRVAHSRLQSGLRVLLDASFFDNYADGVSGAYGVAEGNG